MRPIAPPEDGPPRDGSDATTAWPAAEEFLRSRGAGGTAHPGGTLLDHLIRVANLLDAWGADPDVRAAGLCHAVYGTDGFAQALAETTERALIADLIGERAEALVHLYASCDRDAVYPRLANGGPVLFRDRFTGREHTPPEADVRAFLDLTAANELDVLAHNTELADRHGPGLYGLFTRAQARLSPAARDACVEQLGRYAPDAGAAIGITSLDHLVLTVADIERSVGFYERVLGMRAVTFGDGRRALAFGNSKINLHAAGHELLPHAARPTPGSADLCLLADAPHHTISAALAAQGVPVEEGPVPRTGALGPITSTYVRDPDGNLIEISTYDSGPPADG
ncbi:VOC family protein [Streptomyces sp. NPDC001205]